MKSNNMTNKKRSKTARGYRLRPSTHKLIEKVARAIKSDKDNAIFLACTLFYQKIK